MWLALRSGLGRGRYRAPNVVSPSPENPPSPGNPLAGSCLCGRVRYEITKPFLRAGYCHGSRCRKLTGTLAGINGRVERDGFAS